VFLAPTPTIDLLRLHGATCEVSAAVGTDPWEAYLPGQWVPHCTIAFHMGATALLKVIEASQDFRLPVVGTVTQLGVVAVSPTIPLFSVELDAQRGSG